MTAEQAHFIRTVYLSGATGPVAVGNVLVSNGTKYVVATSANRTSYGRSACIALPAGDDDDTAVHAQFTGYVPTSVTGLGAGSATWVIVSSTGTLERDASPDSGEDVIGKCNARGDLFLAPGVWDETNTLGGSAYTAPTGTGFARITSGSQDAAASAVNLAGGATHVTGTLPVANGGTGATTSTGTGSVVLASGPTLANPTADYLTLSTGVIYDTGGGGITLALGVTTKVWITSAGLRINDGGGQYYTFTPSNIAADRVITLPLLTGDDTMVTEAHSQTLSNKTLGSGTAITYTSVSATGNARYQPTADIANVQTTDATVTTLFSFTPTDEAVTVLTVEALAVRSTGAEVNGYIRRVKIKRDGGTVTLGSVVDVWTDEETAAWDCTVDLSGTTVRVRVTGEGGKTIDWGCTATRQVMTHA
jgi:hypothetical protein